MRRRRRRVDFTFNRLRLPISSIRGQRSPSPGPLPAHGHFLRT